MQPLDGLHVYVFGKVNVQCIIIFGAKVDAVNGQYKALQNLA